MPHNIDYDRGVIKRTHSSGAEIFMYRDDPGVFLNAFGTEVDEKMAQDAGMNIEKYALARRKKARMAEAMELIDAEFLDTSNERIVIKTRGGFNLISLGLGRHILEDPDGNNLTPRPLTSDEGELLFEQMAPSPEKVDPPPVVASEPETTPDIPEVVVEQPKVLTAADVIAQAAKD